MLFNGPIPTLSANFYNQTIFQKCVLLERFPAPAFLYKPNLCLFQNPTGSYLHIDAFESWFGTTGELELFSWLAQSLASSNSDEDFP